MNKIRLSALTSVLIFTAILAGGVAAQESDCTKILSELKAAQTQLVEDKREYRNAFLNWDKYYRQLHSNTYEATDEPLAQSAEKCKNGEYEGKAFCKGALKEFDEISAKESPAKAELDAAKAKSVESRKAYNDLVTKEKENNCGEKAK